MWPERFPLLLLLLLIASTARRANATLGCGSTGNRKLRDTAGTCRAGDIQRVFGGNLLECTNGYVSIIDGLGSSLTFTSHSLSINDKDLVCISEGVHTLLGTPFVRMATLQRCCLPGGVDRSEGVRYTTVLFSLIYSKTDIFYIPLVDVLSFTRTPPQATATQQQMQSMRTLITTKGQKCRV